MVCSACGYIYDPQLSNTDIHYSEDFFSMVGGIPFIDNPDMPDVYACPSCGTMKLDISGLGLTAPAPQESGSTPAPGGVAQATQ